MQSVFVTENIVFIRDNFQKLTDYCATDVELTCRIFGQLYTKFRER